LGWLADEAFGVGVVGGGEHDAALGTDLGSGAGVNVGGGVQAQAAVSMLIVIPREKELAVSPGGLRFPSYRGDIAYREGRCHRHAGSSIRTSRKARCG
jgi:hypothetical protein